MIIAQSAALGIGFVLDLLFGDPDFALHPIHLVISGIEKIMRAIFPKKKGGEMIAGFFAVIFVIAICGGVPFAILFFAYRFHMVLGVVVESVICYSMLSARSLGKAGMSVYNPLMQGDFEKARKNVSMIAEYDTDNLDDTGIAKAAIEAVAKNTSDGVVAPIIYMALGGGVLCCMYGAINAMNSMLGYKNEKYINFGFFASKLGYIVNYIPSRISAYVMILSSFILGFDGKHALKIHKRDSQKYAKSNSVQTESVVAGALKIKLAGDVYRFGELCKKPFIGDAIRDIQYYNIRHTNKLMYMTAVITVVFLVGIKFAIGLFI